MKRTKMKWRLFQTKNINSALMADLFSYTTKSLSKDVFQKIKPVSRVIVKDNILKWEFGVNYWQKMEKRAENILKNETEFVNLAKKRITNHLITISAKNSHSKNLNILLKNSEIILGVFLGPFESVISSLIAKEIGPQNTLTKLINTLSQPEELTFFGNYNLDVLISSQKLIKKYKKKLSFKEFSKKQDVQKTIATLFAKYYALPVDISGKPWNQEHFANLVFKEYGKNTQKSIQDKIKKTKLPLNKIKKEKEKILKQHKNKKIKYYSKIAGEMALLRDWRKSKISLIVVSFQMFLLVLSKEKNIPLEQLKDYKISEIQELIKNDIQVNNNKILKRKEYFSVRLIGNHFDYPKENERKVIETSKKKIFGTIASIDKQKIIRGKVKLIISSEDIIKMKQGDILVSIATNYDLVPAMKKAKAIITDEGGILSHAAIVSRELGVPCLIATKNATQILKDGDKILLDLDKGFFAKIN